MGDSGSFQTTAEPAPSAIQLNGKGVKLAPSYGVYDPVFRQASVVFQKLVLGQPSRPIRYLMS